MIELPESYTLAAQASRTLVGKTIKSATAGAHKHTFAWYTGDPALYGMKLAGKRITGAAAYGGRPEIWAEEMRISLCDGVNTRYIEPGKKRPDKHQLLLEFDDGSALSCSIQMYGGVMLFPSDFTEDHHYNTAKEKPSPYTEAFDESYFDSLRNEVKQNSSVKAFLATKQRIPGFGNGVLHDCLFNARVHPKRKLETLTDADMEALFTSVKSTLKQMLDGGGRDTEKDLFGDPGGYRTLLSSKTLANPCQVCGSMLKREAYMGGNIYYCTGCQRA